MRLTLFARSVWIFAALVFGVTPFASAVDTPYALDELVSGYAAAVSYRDRMAYEAESHAILKVNNQLLNPFPWGRKQPGEQERAIYRKLYRRDGDRLDLVVVKPDVDASATDITDPETHLVRVVIDDGNKSLQLNAWGTRDRASVIGQTWNTFPSQAQLTKYQSQMSLSGGDLLDGNGWGVDRYLDEIYLSASDVRMNPEPQLVDGHRTWLIECSDKEYSYALWIDPEADFHPRRIRQQSLVPDGPGANVTVDSIEFTNISGRMVPVAGHIVVHASYPDGRTSSIDNRFSRHAIELDPDFEAVRAFIMAAPPDYQVRNLDFLNIDWKLVGGKLVQNWDRTALEAMDEVIGEAIVTFKAHQVPTGDEPTTNVDINLPTSVAASGQLAKPVDVWRWDLIAIAALGFVVVGVTLWYRQVLRSRAVYKDR